MRTINWWATIEVTLWGVVAVSLAWMLAVGSQAALVWWDTRHAPAVDETPEDTVSTTRMVELTVHINDDESLTYVTDWPIKVEDLQALRVVIARKVGPVWTSPIFDTFLDLIAEREAADLDAELSDLGGAA